MCDTDIETRYELYDRVITVRLGTGVPLGTRGTIIGVMLGPTHLDTYYEILFDHLPKNSLDAILFSGHNQQCRIKVRSYHLLNYSHSLRVRSMANYAQARSMPNENVWEKRLVEQSSTPPRQTQGPQPTRILKRTSNDTNPTTTPKSAPPSTSIQEKPNFVEATTSSVKEQQPTINSSPSITTKKSTLPQPVTMNSMLLPSSQQNSVLLPALAAKLPEPDITFPSVNPVLPITNVTTTTPLTAFPTNPGTESLLLRAIQESKQVQNLVQQQPAPVQQQWDAIPLPPPLLVTQQKHNEISAPAFARQPWETIPTPTVPSQQQQQQQQRTLDPFISHQDVWKSPPRQPSQNTCMYLILSYLDSVKS
jgi:hypothetical protein